MNAGSMLAIYLETVLGPPFFAGVLRTAGLRFAARFVWTAASAAFLVINVIYGAALHDLLPAAISAAYLTGALAFWWWRRRRDRMKAALGAKSRALRDALVRRAREAARPRPVLRPSPGGAR